MKHRSIFAHIIFILIICIGSISLNTDKDFRYFSPTSLIINKENKNLYIAGKTANAILVYNLNSNKMIGTLKTKLPPKDIQLKKDKLLVACSHSEGELLLVSSDKLKLQSTIKVGHGACAIAVSPKKDEVYVANQFSNDVSVVSLKKKAEIARIPVLRQPMDIEVSTNGRYLFVANFLTATRADADTVTAEVSIIDITSKTLLKNIPLANGSNALRGMCLSNDGKYVFISHNLGRFQVPTTQLEQGWMNTSAISVIDANKLEYVATVLLDEPENGAAGSWGIDCSEKYIFVAHSGTHDLSMIDYHAFVEKLANHPNKDALSYDLRFLSDIRKRVPVLGNGPRSLAHFEDKLYAASYFSDTISSIDIYNTSIHHTKAIALNPSLVNDSVRLGEIYFNDAQYCFQKWQSCNGCHPNDARTDGLNWDLMNDGMGNPKNCKSMLFSHVTAPAMITGIRPTAEVAVRAGFTHIQFVQIEEGHAKAVDQYLKSLQPVPSPYLVDGRFSQKAQKGKEIFEKLECNNCHSGEYFTDLQKHSIGKQGEYDHQNKWDTPTLREVWRTGPYLHDGRSATMKEVFSKEKHGIWNETSEGQIEQLVEYVMSL